MLQQNLRRRCGRIASCRRIWIWLARDLAGACIDEVETEHAEWSKLGGASVDGGACRLGGR